MKDEKVYRKKLLGRPMRKIIWAFALIFLVGLCWFLIKLPFERVPLFVAAVAILAVVAVCLVVSVVFYVRMRRWPIVTGVVDEVVLDDEDSQPTTVAKIRFATDGGEHVLEWGLSSFGDWYEGCEPDVAEMLAKDRERYEGCRVPVFCSPKNPDKSFPILRDIEKDESEE